MKNIFLALLFLIVLTLGYLYSQERGISARRANMMALQQDSLNIERKAFVVNEDLLNRLKKENETLREDIKQFKRIDSYTKVKTVTKIDTVSVSFVDTVPYFGVLKINIDSTLFKLAAEVDNKSFRLNKLNIPNEYSIVVGEKKIKGWTGISKGTEYQINVSNSNPLVRNIDMNHYTVKEEKKWYQTQGFAVGAGIITGIIIGK